MCLDWSKVFLLSRQVPFSIEKWLVTRAMIVFLKKWSDTHLLEHILNYMHGVVNTNELSLGMI